MKKKSLVYYEILKYQPGNLDFLNQNFKMVSLPNPGHDTDTILAEADVILAPLGYYLGREKIDKAGRLKVIASNTTGHPHIDVEYAKGRGVRVITLKDEHEFLGTITPTAELTWGLLVALTRNIMPAYRSVLDGKWDRRPFGGKRMLSQMKLGVAGFGRLGKMVAAYGKSFGMAVEFYDPHADQQTDQVRKVGTLEELIAENDIISIHIPHLPETENLFNHSILSLFKKGAYLINTSRGELIDFTALLELLKNKHLGGAALDVFENEFTPGFERQLITHPLFQYAKENDNLILTPHIGGSTVDAWTLTEKHTLDLIIEALS